MFWNSLAFSENVWVLYTFHNEFYQLNVKNKVSKKYAMLNVHFCYKTIDNNFVYFTHTIKIDLSYNTFPENFWNVLSKTKIC